MGSVKFFITCLFPKLIVNFWQCFLWGYLRKFSKTFEVCLEGKDCQKLIANIYKMIYFETFYLFTFYISDPKITSGSCEIKKKTFCWKKKKKNTILKHSLIAELYSPRNFKRSFLVWGVKISCRAQIWLWTAMSLNNWRKHACV